MCGGVDDQTAASHWLIPRDLENNTYLLWDLHRIVAKDFKLSYQNPETILFTRYPEYGNLNQIPQQQPTAIEDDMLFGSFGAGGDTRLTKTQTAGSLGTSSRFLD